MPEALENAPVWYDLFFSACWLVVKLSGRIHRLYRWAGRFRRSNRLGALDASTALVELHLLKQLRYVAQLLIAGKVPILLYVVDYPFAIVKQNEKAIVWQGV